MTVSLHPSYEEFCELAKRGNVVPVYADIIADGDTPVSAFRKLENGEFCFLFESAEQKEGSGRFSFLGFYPRLVLESDGRNFSIREIGEVHSSPISKDPLVHLEEVMRRFTFVPAEELPRFAGGAVGFLGYDVVRSFEPTVPLPKHNALGLPEMMFMVMNLLVVFDHRERRMKLIANAFLENGEDGERAYAAAKALIESALARLASPCELPYIDAQRPSVAADAQSNMSQEHFEAAVETAKQHIVAGDVFQVVLSQRFQTEFSGDPLELYRCLRLINPSPYMFCLRLGNFSLVGSSPELHVRVVDRTVEVRPIAGTRRRGKNAEEDERNSQELLADPKERAEHVMLVDLARNDLGRIAEFGSVRVTEQMIVERYSHVMHIVSHVTARLAAGKTAYDVMRATFPAGTVSGAPKIRAMQIINELEQEQRGCYAGAVGYFGFDGALDCCIALRSVVLKNNRAYVQAGAGIVADSNPCAEYKETVSKAMATMHAIGRAAEISHGSGNR
jgi:anthranilate synthase component I